MSPATPRDLRSLDWRFLLPAPEGGRFRRLVILGGTPEQAAQALEADLADAVDTRLAAGADAVVVLARADADVGAVADALVDDGVVYWEVDRRRPGRHFWTPRRLRRALRAHGCAASAVYGVTPDFHRPHMYLPLLGTAPLRWFLRALFLMDTPAKRGVGTALSALARGPSGVRAIERVLPSYCVVAARGDRPPPPVPSVMGSRALPEPLQIPGVQTLLLAWGQNESNRIAIMPFAPDAERPAYVLKVSRSAVHAQGTVGDQRALAAIHPRLTGPLRDTVPRPLGTFEWNGIPVGVESCAPGRLLSCVVGQWGTPFRAQVAAFEQAADWITRFHREVQFGAGTWDAAAIARFVDAPLRRYAATLRVVGAEAQLFAAARARADMLRGETVPEVWQHTGYAGVNVFSDDRTAYVIDWESSCPGLPLLDLLHLAADWSQAVHRAGTEPERLADFRRLFLATPVESRCAPVVARALRRYVTALGLPWALLPLVHVLHHVSRALGYVDRAGRQPGAREENAYARYVEALADHTEQLFPA